MSQVSYGTITITDTNDIENIYLVYAGSNSSTVAPTTPWNQWITDVTQITSDYVWQRTVIKRSGVDVTESDYGAPVCVTGPEGNIGVGISSVTTLYCNYKSGEPPATSARWQSSVPAYDSNYPNYWVKTTINYTNGTSGTPIIYQDNGLTSATAKAATAEINAADAKQLATATNTTVNTLNQHFWWNGTTTSGLPSGAYILNTPVDTFKSTKQGSNLYINSNGVYIRNDLVDIVSLTKDALEFYSLPATGVSSKKSIRLDANGLQIYYYNDNVQTIGLSFTSTTAQIGNWFIKGNALYYGDAVPGLGHVIVSTGTETTDVSIANSPMTWEEEVDGQTITRPMSWMLAAGENFGVTVQGSLYAAGASIDGRIVATSGEIGGCLIEDGALSIGNAYISNTFTIGQKITNMESDNSTLELLTNTLNDNIGITNITFTTDGDGENPSEGALSSEYFSINNFDFINEVQNYGTYDITCQIEPTQTFIIDEENIIDSIDNTTFINQINSTAGQYTFQYMDVDQVVTWFLGSEEITDITTYGITIKSDAQLYNGLTVTVQYPNYTLSLNGNVINTTVLNLQGIIPNTATTTIVTTYYQYFTSLSDRNSILTDQVSSMVEAVDTHTQTLNIIENELRPYRGYLEFTDYPSIIVGKGNLNNYVEIVPDRVSIYSTVGDVFVITNDTTAQANKNYYRYSNGRFIKTVFTAGTNISYDTLHYYVYEQGDTDTSLNETTYMSGERMYSTNIVTANLFMQTTDVVSNETIGNLGWVMRTNGHLSLKRMS